MGKTTLLRTAIISFKPSKAKPVLSCFKSMSKVGIMSSTALFPIVSNKTSNARAAAFRTPGEESTMALRIKGVQLMTNSVAAVLPAEAIISEMPTQAPSLVS